MALTISRNGQGSSSAVRVTAVLLCVMLVAEYVSAGQVAVGSTRGWVLGAKYGNLKVKTKDSILFKYASNQHNVLQVSKADYDSCNSRKPVKRYTSGMDRLTITKAGTYYFICGIGNHCASGMKVVISVSK